MWKRSAPEALKRAHAFAEYDLLFLEEPVLQEAVSAYREICDNAPPNLRIAGGEGSDTVRMAEDFIVNGGVSQRWKSYSSQKIVSLCSTLICVCQVPR
jgi:L-alanine-DL-glutamate epimerase-like enolase superfamily enzyme